MKLIYEYTKQTNFMAVKNVGSDSYKLPHVIVFSN